MALMESNLIYAATDREVRFATEWHGGQGSMLYAVASTGALSLGTIRPSWGPGEPMSDTEWKRDLLGRLQSELEDCYPDDGADHDIRFHWLSKLAHKASELGPGDGYPDSPNSVTDMTTTITYHVVIDDERTLVRTADDDRIVHLRTSADALDYLDTMVPTVDYLYLDHDLGGDDTIRPVVDYLEERAFNGSAPLARTICVHTANPVGADMILNSRLLNRDYLVVRIGLGGFTVDT